MLQVLKEAHEALRIIAKLAGFDHLTLLHRQGTHQRRLHPDIDTYHIGRCRWGRLLRRCFSHHCALCSHALACRYCRQSQRETHPVGTSENSSWIGSLAGAPPGAATSLIVAWNPDGGGAVYGSVVTALSRRPHVTTMALPSSPSV